jgi:hypothetical protein
MNESLASKPSRICPHCSAVVADDATYCPNCAHALTRKPDKAAMFGAWALLILVGGPAAICSGCSLLVFWPQPFDPNTLPFRLMGLAAAGVLATTIWGFRVIMRNAKRS